MIMHALLRRLTPIFMLLLAVALVEGGLTAQYAEARSMSGGRSFRMTPRSTPKQAPSQMKRQQTPQKQPGFGRSLAGGLMGGALGALLFGSLFGMGGSGMGILPLLLLAGVGYFLFRKLTARPQTGGNQGFRAPPFPNQGSFAGGEASQAPSFDIPPVAPPTPLEEGVEQIRQLDPGFDQQYFTEVASDVFFKIQAGWMHRDLSAFRHLLGDQLAAEYAQHLAELEAKGQVNKLESIAIRSIAVVAAGSDGQEDFVTVRFTASLLDYTMDEASGQVVSGSTVDPVKFDENWTWARPVRTQEWRLEGVEVVGD
jgi:predicted lipid-binding transport protein (Tim44 family)